MMISIRILLLIPLNGTVVQEARSLFVIHLAPVVVAVLGLDVIRTVLVMQVVQQVVNVQILTREYLMGLRDRRLLAIPSFRGQVWLYKTIMVTLIQFSLTMLP